MDAEKQKFLKESFKLHDYIVIDASSLMDEGAQLFWEHIDPLLQEEARLRKQIFLQEGAAPHEKVVVPYAICKELQKIKDDPSRSEYVRMKAKAAYDKVFMLRNDHMIRTNKMDNEGAFGDHAMEMIVAARKLEDNLLILTQDRALAKDLLNLGRSNGAVQTRKKVHVSSIGKDGYLQPALKKMSPLPMRKGIPKEECFDEVHTLQSFSGKMTLTHCPQAYDAVKIHDSAGREAVMHLQEEISHGGEGVVYRTDYAGLVAKIYSEDKVDRMRYEKLKRMAEKKIRYPGICFPQALVSNMDDEFCGFLMPVAKGRTLGDSVYRLWDETEPFHEWKKKDTVRLCITILKAIRYLHRRNVLLGDINMENILVESPDEVYFVDADSFQIEGFPCPVGMTNFTAPEILGRHFPEFLRTIANENFAIATLLFTIMLPGKFPYEMQGGANQAENIRSGDFPYPLGEISTGRVPDGLWRFCWSHLPVKTMKAPFFHTFRKNGEHYAPEDRIGVDDWLKKFQDYEHRLLDDTLKQQDRESLEIFPVRFKKHSGETYAVCRCCHREMEARTMWDGICKACRDETVREIRCVECGRTFELTRGEEMFYESHNLSLPKRCGYCKEEQMDDEEEFEDD